MMIPDLRSFLPSVLRTFVPLLVGLFSSWPAVAWLGLDGEHVTAAAVVLVTAGYWLVVRVLETYIGPRFGWLLGYAARPVYPNVADAGSTAGAVGDVARVVVRTIGTR